MKKRSSVSAILGLVVGALAVILAVVLFVAVHTGTYTDYRSYGGDAYTGIQHAAADTARNVSRLAVLERDGFCAILLVMGLGMVCYFIGKLEEIKAQNRAMENPPQMAPMPRPVAPIGPNGMMAGSVPPNEMYGRPVPPEYAQPVRPTATVKTPEAVSKWTCPHCRTINAGESRFCVACGCPKPGDARPNGSNL